MKGIAMTIPAGRVGDHTEADLISRVGTILGPRLSSRELVVGVGDDAAAWHVPAGAVVLSTDMFCENEDFRTDWSSPEDVGFKVVVQNVADIVAMGARCSGLLLSAGFPAATPMVWFDGFLHGVREGAETYDVFVAGGDLSGAGVIVVNTTSFGHSEQPVVQRCGANSGDGVWISGSVGRSAAGLWALQQGCASDEYANVVKVHRRPEPDLLAARGAMSAASAGLDVSDGLLKDAGRIARASGCDVHLDADALGQWVTDLTKQVNVDRTLAEEWVYTGGEEHVILATFPAEVTPEPPFVRIGDVVQQVGDVPEVMTGLAPFDRDGFDHFG